MTRQLVIGVMYTTPWNPKPYILHLHPQALNPTPYTLHPTPYTLHPTPYTLHPTPYTLMSAGNETCIRIPRATSDPHSGCVSKTLNYKP